MIDLLSKKNCPDWTPATDYLVQSDPLLANWIQRVGPCTISRRREYFPALCQSIISQQVSTAAARSIFKKFRYLFDDRKPRAAQLLKLKDPHLRGAGLSPQKINYVRGIAEAFHSGQIPVRRLTRMSDEEVIECLVELKGVGRWTAEMFLIFVLQRPDVLPIDDLGLQVGVQKLFKLKNRPKPIEIPPLTDHWKPYRSVATWYLWRGIEQERAREKASEIL